MSALSFIVISTATNCCKREEIVNKLLTILVTVMSLLGFVQLTDLVQERPQFGVPLLTVLTAIWLYAALIGYRDKR
jgi:Flp pilus assembly protein protease CpaA